MQVMQKIAGGLDTGMVFNSVLRQFGECPEKLTLRGKTPQGSVENWLFFDTLPLLRPIIFGVMNRIEGEALGEVDLVGVPPGVTIQAPALESDEHYVVALNVAPGVGIGAQGGQPQAIFPGDVWWVSGKLELVLLNSSQEPAALLVLSAKPNSPATYFPATE